MFEYYNRICTLADVLSDNLLLSKLLCMATRSKDRRNIFSVSVSKNYRQLPPVLLFVIIPFTVSFVVVRL